MCQEAPKNILAKLQKGKATRLACKNSHKAAAKRKGVAEKNAPLLDSPNEDGSTSRKVLAAKLVLNMDKSPELYKLGLRMMGERRPNR